MNTKFWGPSMWVTIHTIAFGYPVNPTEAQMGQYRDFYANMQYTLPCSYCRQSFSEFLKIMPIENYLGTRYQLAYWTYIIHDMVNKKLSSQTRKKITSPPFIEVVKKYEKARVSR